jgi:hypothetical protein
MRYPDAEMVTSASAAGEPHGIDESSTAMEHKSTMTRDLRDISLGAALKFVVLLGVVSLFSDMTYEGARSIAGP